MALDHGSFAAASLGGTLAAGFSGPFAHVPLAQFALVSIGAWAGVVARLASEASDRRKRALDGGAQLDDVRGFDFRALGYDSLTAPLLGNLAVALAISWGFSDGYLLFSFAMASGYTGTQLLRWGWDTAKSVIAQKLGVSP